MLTFFRAFGFLVPLVLGSFGVALVYEVAPRAYGQLSFLDVGQGDAAYIRLPDGTDILIDGGPDEQVIHELSKVMPMSDRHIDVVVMTHSDADHSSGLVAVVERYSVGELIVSGATSTSPVREALDIAARMRGVRISVVGAGDTFVFIDPQAQFAVYSPSLPTQPPPEDSNAQSIVLRMAYGSTTALFMGDADSAVELGLVAAHGATLKSSVLKVGHHGSKTSSADQFIEAVQPVYSVISAGRDNRFGHPDDEVLATLASHASTTVVQTKQEGTITFLFDSSGLWRAD